MKLPNGYGSIYKLSGKRRKPWIVRKTVGWKIDPVTHKSVSYTHLQNPNKVDAYFSLYT